MRIWWQQSEKDSEVEEAALLALNKLTLFKADDRERVRCVRARACVCVCVRVRACVCVCVLAD